MLQGECHGYLRKVRQKVEKVAIIRTIHHHFYTPPSFFGDLFASKWTLVVMFTRGVCKQERLLDFINFLGVFLSV